jgi:hypothetical protein
MAARTTCGTRSTDAPAALPHSLTVDLRHRLGDCLAPAPTTCSGLSSKSCSFAVVPTGDANADRARSVGRDDVLRGVTENEHALWVERRAENLAGTLDRLAR